MSAPSEAEAFFADDDQGQPEPAEWTRVEIPGDIPRGRGGRPKVRRLLSDGREDPTTLVDYTRASNLGETLEDTFAINLREKRMVAWAVAHDPALRAKAQAIETVTEPADKKALREIVETALVVCRASTGADRGTAMHWVGEQYDHGKPLDHLETDLLVALGKYSELIAGFEVLSWEGFVVCDELEAAGSYDKIVTPRWPMEVRRNNEVLATIQPGDRIVLDKKFGADAKWFGPNYAVQQPTYANGTPYTHEGGRGSWPDGKPPRRDWSLILHVPIESPEDAGLWWVDLEAGMELARLAALARKVRRRAGMFLPAEPPTPPASADPFAYAGLPRISPPTDDEEEPRSIKLTADEAKAARLAHAEMKLEPLCTDCDHDTFAEARRCAADTAKAERTILGLIHATRSHADLVKVWERYAGDGWTPACTTAADAHLVTLRVMSR